MRRTAAVVTLATLGLAACSTEASSPMMTDPGATLPPVATTSTTTTTTEPPPTTTAPTTTSTTEPPPTTIAPTTTEAPPSGPPVDATVPLFAGGGGGGWLYLGSWQTNAWASAFAEDDTPIEPAVEPGSDVAVSRVESGTTSGTLGATAEACFDGRVGPTVDPAVAPPQPPGFGYGAIALAASWALQPRPVVDIEAAIPAYETAGEAAFAGTPVDATLGNVEQIVLADLDGDGDEEALVAFEYVDSGAVTGAEGDLSAVLLVDTATGTSTTIESSFVGPVEEEEAAAAEVAVTPIIERFRVLDVSDLNGDGRMEVVLHAWYYEGAAALVYEYDGTSLTGVLASGCGA